MLFQSNLRKQIRKLPKFLKFVRIIHYSSKLFTGVLSRSSSARTAGTMAWVSVEKHPDGHAVITLAKEPVNSMDAKLWQQMYDAFMECENDTKVRGASGLGEN